MEPHLPPDPVNGPAAAAGRIRPQDLFEALLVAVLCALFVRTFLVQGFQVPSPSMEPGLLAGDHILVNKFLYAHLRHGEAVARWLPARDVRRGDVVVFMDPNTAGRRLLKRCLGRPGDVVEIGGGQVLVNRHAVAEPYVHETAVQKTARERYVPYRVPPGHYFFLGDRRDNSSDSRAWGTVRRDLVRGRPAVIYWSADPSVLQGRAGWGMMERFRSLFAGTRWERCFKRVR